MVNVKNRVDQVMSRLPPLVQLEGVVVNFVQPSMLMYVEPVQHGRNRRTRSFSTTTPT